MSTKKYTEDEFFEDNFFKTNNLRPLMKLAGCRTQKEFANFLGITIGGISNAIANKKIPNTWPDRMIEKKPDLDRNAIFKIMNMKEKGSKMENSVLSSSPLRDLGENQVLVSNAEQLALPEVFRAILELKRSWVMSEFSENIRDLLVWVMDSDNMTPTLTYQDLLLIDKRIKNIEGDGIYAFRINDEIKIRRVMHRMDGGIDMINDNRSYPAMNINLGIALPQVQITGRVIRVMKRI